MWKERLRKTEQCGPKNYKGPAKRQNGDEDETTEKQEEIIMQFKAEGDRHDTEDERGSLKSQLTWSVAEDKVNVPENSIVTEMIKQL